MPLPLITDTVRCAIQMSSPGVDDPVVNVIHLFNDEAGSPTDPDSTLQGAWHTFVSQEVQSIFVMDKITYTQLNGSAGIDVAWTGGANTNPSSLFPMNAAICYSWRTLLAGRSHRGRSYIGPTGPNRIDTTHPDQWDPTFLINGTSRGNSFIAAMDSAGFPLQVASYTLADSFPVDHVVVNPKVCTQRRRVNSR